MVPEEEADVFVIERNDEIQKDTNENGDGLGAAYLAFQSKDYDGSSAGVDINNTNIRIWIHERDLESLEKVLWEGEGFTLIKHTSGHAKVRKFLEAVPRLMVSLFYILWLPHCIPSLFTIHKCKT